MKQQPGQKPPAGQPPAPGKHTPSSGQTTASQNASPVRHPAPDKQPPPNKQPPTSQQPPTGQHPLQDQQPLPGLQPMPMGGIQDPNMMPMDGMAPDETQNLMDYAVDLNPYRKTLEVFLMLSMLTTFLGVFGYCILSYIIVEYFFASGGLLHKAGVDIELCVDDACGEYEHRTMGFVKWKSNPCDSYFEYACWGFRKEAVDLNYADYRPYHEVMEIEYGILIELLFQDASDQWPTKIVELHRLAKNAYRLCRASEGLHADLVGELYSAKSRGVGFVLSKFEQLHPIWCFYTPVVADDKCYLFPPNMFVPEVLYKSSDFKDEFSIALREPPQAERRR
ncbi:hypothetical protein MRX96_021897 [Rhipicephalus microplus]